MRIAQRNLQPFYYCLYEDAEDQFDEYGNLVSEPLKTYAEPVLMYANISPATGQTMAEQFGNLENYDKVIVTTDMACPIDEHTVLFVDKQPEHSTDGRLMFDYIVKGISKSLNGISIAVKKVDVG